MCYVYPVILYVQLILLDLFIHFQYPNLQIWLGANKVWEQFHGGLFPLGN